MVQIFLTKLLKCIDISSDAMMVMIIDKLTDNMPLSTEEEMFLKSMEEATVKEGYISSSISLIGPTEIDGLEDLIGNMLIVNEDGTYRFADDYDLSLFFNIPMFAGMPCGFAYNDGEESLEIEFGEL